MMKCCSWLAYLLSGVGAINWGLKAFFGLDIVESLAKAVPSVPYLDKIIYGLIAVSGILTILTLFAGSCHCTSCK
ncbi:TPA: DUF378 domain-containing protein [Candidatus Dependentiae bacterium]|nr:MAG: hypothetical protein UR14_C0006G0004 [candidate division TM6 bacterium GW2011_GWE2_31_21]KKP53573.1 MAG: hypothetical protein UR43_C0004G0114 [candidate division TM6 bacterium GW2011_GWF2_33_332]HBS48186.1 DUF378 domain-containing protein [Candidatus Dependentiae bacterium]HBZ73611.1 DUF378 domain-containing protein [Candidatus Dependentiae bacterium]